MSELGEHKGNGIRYSMHLSAPNGVVAQMLRDPEGGWVSWEDYAKLKAEFDKVDQQRRVNLVDAGSLFQKNARLKAEVDRLTSDLQMEKENEDRLVRLHQKANNEVYGLQSQVAALIDDQTRLKAEVERLNTGIQPEGSNDAVGRAVNVLLEKEKENARLKAEVERLTDEVGLMNQMFEQHLTTEVRKAIVKAAKQGGQP